MNSSGSTDEFTVKNGLSYCIPKILTLASAFRDFEFDDNWNIGFTKPCDDIYELGITLVGPESGELNFNRFKLLPFKSQWNCFSKNPCFEHVFSLKSTQYSAPTIQNKLRNQFNSFIQIVQIERKLIYPCKLVKPGTCSADCSVLADVTDAQNSLAVIRNTANF